MTSPLSICFVLLAAAAASASEDVGDLGAQRPDHATEVARVQALIGDAATPVQRSAIEIANLHPSAPEALHLLRMVLARGTPAADACVLMSLRHLGPSAGGMSGEVIAMVADPARPTLLRALAIATLLALQPTPPAVGIVVSALQDPQLPYHARAQAAMLLDGWGAASVPASAALNALVDDGDSELAVCAYWAATDAAKQTDPGVDAPLARLRELSVARQGAWLRCLVRHQPLSTVCIRALLALARDDPRHGARAAAWMTVARVGLGDAQAVAAMLDMSSARDPFLAQLSRQALAADAGQGFPGVGHDSAVVAALAAALDCAHPDTISAAEDALRTLGVDAAPARTALLDMLARHGGLPLRQVVATLHVMAATGSSPAPIQHRVAHLLEPGAALYRNRAHDDVDAIQAVLFCTLARIGVPLSARRWILAALANPEPGDPVVFAAATLAAGAEQADAGYAVQALVAALDPGFADAAIDVLAFGTVRRRSHGQRVVPAALPATGDSARVLAIRALAAIGPAARAALPALRRIARDGIANAGNRALLAQEACTAIGCIDAAPQRNAAP